MKKILEILRNLKDQIHYKLSGRNKYIKTLGYKIYAIRTQKRADLLEVEIRRKLAGDLLVVERQKLEDRLEELNDLRDKL